MGFEPPELFRRLIAHISHFHGRRGWQLHSTKGTVRENLRPLPSFPTPPPPPWDCRSPLRPPSLLTPGDLRWLGRGEVC